VRRTRERAVACVGVHKFSASVTLCATVLHETHLFSGPKCSRPHPMSCSPSEMAARFPACLPACLNACCMQPRPHAGACTAGACCSRQSPAPSWSSCPPCCSHSWTWMMHQHLQRWQDCSATWRTGVCAHLSLSLCWVALQSELDASSNLCLSTI
jgi:hypothetical protein